MQGVELSAVSLHTSIHDAVTFCEPFAKVNECRVVVNEEGIGNLMIMANQLRLEQILINLVSNAIKYAGAGTEVQVGVRQCSKKDAVSEALLAGTSDFILRPREDAEAAHSSDCPVAIVTIRDQGRGIPEEEMSSLFREFSQLSISKEKDNVGRPRQSHAIGQSSGSGLGLNLVLKFVTLVRVRCS